MIPKQRTLTHETPCVGTTSAFNNFAYYPIFRGAHMYLESRLSEAPLTDVLQSQAPVKVSDNPPEETREFFVTDFDERFFFKKVSAKARAKAQNPIWGGRLVPLGTGPPKLVLGFGSGFGTDFFEKKTN